MLNKDCHLSLVVKISFKLDYNVNSWLPNLQESKLISRLQVHIYGRPFLHCLILKLNNALDALDWLLTEQFQPIKHCYKWELIESNNAVGHFGYLIGEQTISP